MEESQVPEENVSPFAGFDPEVQRDVAGLVYLGALQDEFSFCAHHFVLRTLTAAEDIATGLAVAPFRDTLKEAEAFAAAKVGLALVSIDGDEEFCPRIGPDEQAFAKARFRWVTSQWFPPLIGYLFERLTQLELRQVEAVEALENLSTRSPQISLPFVDSLTEPGDLDEPTPGAPVETPS